MFYDYACSNEECGNLQEEEHSVNGFKEFTPKCALCESLCRYQYTPSIPQVAFKDGNSGWPSKAGRFNEYRRKQSEKMERKQKDRYGHLNRDAIPNYNGQDTGTWAEAQNMALKEKGKESAATFEKKIQAEQKASK